jgi:hypothetical protein
MMVGRYVLNKNSSFCLNLAKNMATMNNSSSDFFAKSSPLKLQVEMICNFTNGVCLMVFNATFNNISVTSWRLVLLVEETEGPRENHRAVAGHLALTEIQTHNISGDRH